MSEQSYHYPRDPGDLVLSWSEAPNCPSHEEFVQMIEARQPLATIRSALKISEKTRVYLIRKDYRQEGIVHSCQSDGAGFIVTLRMFKQTQAKSIERDPGCQVVEDFLTEEQEELLLKSLEN